MPAALKLVTLVNIVTLIALALLALFASGRLAPGAYSSHEGYEIELVPVEPDRTAAPVAASPAQRAEIPSAYRDEDPVPTPWTIMPDGSVKFTREE